MKLTESIVLGLTPGRKLKGTGPNIYGGDGIRRTWSADILHKSTLESMHSAFNIMKLPTVAWSRRNDHRDRTDWTGEYLNEWDGRSSMATRMEL